MRDIFHNSSVANATLFAVVLAVTAGCQSAPKSRAASPVLRSEREYGELRENIARDLVKTGQATSLDQARLEAASIVNAEWAAAAKAKAKRKEKETFEKDFRRFIEK